MEMLEIMERRHSVRQYQDRPIEMAQRMALNAMAEAINREAGLHIQMIYDDKQCFDSFMARYGKFSGVANYIALVGPKGADAEEKLGYYGEKLVLEAQAMGLNTCWVALTHGKSRAQVAKGEKCVCLIALGYGATQGVAHKDKPMQNVATDGENLPEWFKTGVKAALLAPTAMNQQKFFFELLPDGSVKARKGSGFYTQLDLGIVKYHFEAVTGKKVG